MRQHLDTLGNPSISEKRIAGELPPNPSGVLCLVQVETPSCHSV